MKVHIACLFHMVKQLLTYVSIDNIQLMHSFEVNTRICQHENSEHHFRGLTNPDVNRKRITGQKDIYKQFKSCVNIP